MGGFFVKLLQGAPPSIGDLSMKRRAAACFDWDAT